MNNRTLNLIDVPSRQLLCIITSDKEFENIDEMTRDIWTHFDGICAVVHTQGGDDRVFDLLESRKGCGFVVKQEFLWHHSHSMNRWLLDRRINLLDTCWIRDSSERFNPEFTNNIRQFSDQIMEHNIWNLVQYSKLLMFRRWYNQQFFNGLHWGLNGLYGNTAAIEQIPQFKDDKKCAYSVRNEKRPFDHRYRHECLYLLNYGANGNHLQLFHNDPKDLDISQWDLFYFTKFLRENDVIDVDQLITYLQNEKRLDTQVKWWINAERPFRNLYRYFVLKHTNEEILKDEDTWRLL